MSTPDRVIDVLAGGTQGGRPFAERIVAILDAAGLDVVERGTTATPTTTSPPSSTSVGRTIRAALAAAHDLVVMDGDPFVCSPGPRHAEAIEKLRATLPSTAVADFEALLDEAERLAGAILPWVDADSTEGQPPTEWNDDDYAEQADALRALGERVEQLVILADGETATARPGPGLALIVAERWRQVLEEEWTPEHDDHHTDDGAGIGPLATAAACYALQITEPWPFDQPPAELDRGWRDDASGRRRELVKAGALVAAEIDRLDRQEQHR